MFKKHIKERFKGCHTREDFLKIRRELKNFDEGIFKKEYKTISSKYNPFIKLILGKTRDNSVDHGDFVLTPDRDHKDHSLLLPKDTTYFNILVMTKKDLPMLKNMKELINNNLGEKELYFHCYPFNSIHTLHLHIFNKSTYNHRSNDLNIDDAIFVIENENKLSLGIINTSGIVNTSGIINTSGIVNTSGIINNEEIYENIIKDWFDKNDISLLNIYFVSLILIEKTGQTEKEQLLPYSLNYILEYLDIDKENILNYYKEEKETLNSIGKLLFCVSKNPELLQKDIL